MNGLGQNLVIGVLLGGVYSLLASGMTLIFGIMKVINLAQGAFIVLASFLTWTAWQYAHVDPLVSIPAVAVSMFAIGYFTYQVVVRPVAGMPVSSSVLLTMGIALVLESVMGVIWGNTEHSLLPPYATEAFRVGSVAIPKTYLYGSGMAILILLLLFLFLGRTWQGRAIRASAVNRDGARLVGVKTASVAALTFAIGVSTAGAGGSIVGILYPFVPSSHYQWIARLLAIIVLGGLGSIPGALVGAIVLALAEVLAGAYLSSEWATAVPYIATLVVLLVRPRGLFGALLREDGVAA